VSGFCVRQRPTGHGQDTSTKTATPGPAARSAIDSFQIQARTMCQKNHHQAAAGRGGAVLDGFGIRSLHRPGRRPRLKGDSEIAGESFSERGRIQLLQGGANNGLLQGLADSRAGEPAGVPGRTGPSFCSRNTGQGRRITAARWGEKHRRHRSPGSSLDRPAWPAGASRHKHQHANPSAQSRRRWGFSKQATDHEAGRGGCGFIGIDLSAAVSVRRACG